MSSQSRDRFTFNETADGIKISTRLENHPFHFILALVTLIGLVGVVVALFISIIPSFGRVFVPNATNNPQAILLIYVPVLIVLYVGFISALENAFRREEVSITPQSITILRSGFLLFRKKIVLPAGQVRGIQPTIQIAAVGSKMADMLINTSKMGKLSISSWKRLAPIYTICREISEDEKVDAFDRILEKYPQYHYK